jgi:hypothetical protein
MVMSARSMHGIHGGCGAEQAPSMDWLGGAIVGRGLGRRCESSNRHRHGGRWASKAGRGRETMEDGRQGTSTRRPFFILPQSEIS